MRLHRRLCGTVVLATSTRIVGQLVDKNKAPNTANEGITRPLTGSPYPSQIGDGRTGTDPNASHSVIALDPFRAIRRGRQLFQRKFTRLEGPGPVMGDGFGNIDVDLAIGAGLSDSCAGCHGRPRGSAGFGGDVVTRPDSRDAPHLFGLGLKEMLADEITTRPPRDSCDRDCAGVAEQIAGHDGAGEQGHQLRYDPSAARRQRRYIRRRRRRCGPARSPVLLSRRHVLDPGIHRRRAEERARTRDGRRPGSRRRAVRRRGQDRHRHESQRPDGHVRAVAGRRR